MLKRKRVTSKKTYALRKKLGKKPRRVGAIQRHPAGVFRSSTSEIKSIDIFNPAGPALYINIFQPPNTLSARLLNGIQTGAAFFNRVGSKVEMKYVHIRGQIYNNTTPTGVDQLRVLVIYDRQCNGGIAGAIPAINDVIQSRDQVGTAFTNGLSEINLDQRDRYVILRDHQVITPSIAATLVSNPDNNHGEDYNLNLFIPLKNLVTHYKSSSNPCTIGDINTGAMYIYFVATDTTDWSCEWSARLRYVDL